MLHNPWRSAPAWLTVLLLAGLPACRMPAVRLWQAARSMPGTAYEVDAYRDIGYQGGPGVDVERHRLDLYLPRGLSGYPVVMLVHGGAWTFGDNRCCGLYTSVAEFLAGQGIGVAVPCYRLAPETQHPGQVRDVARAFAWLYAHIADFGGCPEQLFLVGHSAGGHLVSLLATDETYVRAEGLTGSAIRGVVAVSGVYRIPAGPLAVCLGGTTSRSFCLDELLPLRGMADSLGRACPGLPLRLNVFGPVFGDDPEVRATASPVNHVRPGLPPFLILHAEKELPALTQMAEEFHQALRDNGCDAQRMKVAGRNHHSILFAAVEPGDAVAGAITTFVRRHATAADPHRPVFSCGGGST